MAQDAPTLLWKSLSAGDSPEKVAEKLTADPIFKSVKIKRSRDPLKEPDISVKYVDDGVRILGIPYLLSFSFEQGSLKRVTLMTLPMCANKALEQFRDMVSALSEKYPTSPVKFQGSDEDRLKQAFLKGTDENPAVAGRLFTGSGTVVFYQQRFTAEAPPPSGYTPNPRVGALMGLMANQYDSRVRECDGTGDHRMTHMLTYMTEPDFREMDKGIRDEHRGQLEAAKSQL